MKRTLRGLCLLPLCAACGEEEAVDTKLTAAPDSASIASLDEDQLEALCEQINDQNEALVRAYEEELCTMAGMNAAAFQRTWQFPESTEEELRQTCVTARDDCLDDPDRQLMVQDCEDIGFYASMVTTTVGELNACRSAFGEFYSELSGWLPSCDGELEGFVERRDERQGPTLEACEAVVDGFPDALDCSEGTDALDADWICDGVDDCAGGEDEADC